MRITEIKKHLDGRIEEFECDALVWEPERAIVNFVWHPEEPMRDGPIFLPAEEIHTLAYFWTDRDYLIYRILSAAGALFGHRFDICERVEISDRALVWTDLILDLWVNPNLKCFILDEDQLREVQSQGLLSPRQLEKIEATRQHLLENYRAIIDALATSHEM